jgi:hypothetical protein
MLIMTNFQFNLILVLLTFSPLIYVIIRWGIIEKLTRRYRIARKLHHFTIESRQNFDDILFQKIIDETSIECIVYFWEAYTSELKAHFNNSAGTGLDNYSVRLDDKITIQIEIDAWFRNNMTLPSGDYVWLL